MAARACTSVQSFSICDIGLFAGPGARAAQCVRDSTAGHHIYAVAEAVGSTAKRIKLTIWPESEPVPPPQPSTPPQQPSTPTRRISHSINVSPSTLHRSETAILHNARETGLRRSRQTLRWVADQSFFGDAVREFEDTESAIVDRPQTDGQPMNGLVFAPMMTGALQLDDLRPFDEAPEDEASHGEAMLVDESEFDSQDSYDSDPSFTSDVRESSPSSLSSDGSDSVTSSMLEGLTEEDLQKLETKREKKERKRRERQAEAARVAANRQAHEEQAARDPTCLLAQLRRVAETTAQPQPLKKSVAFYNDPKTGNPVAVIKEFDSDDPITPPIKQYVPTTQTSFPAIRPHKVRETVAHENRLPNTPTTTDERTSPASLAKTTSRLTEATTSPLGLKISGRRSSSRQSEIDLAAQFERDRETAIAAAEAERLAQEEAERKAIEEAQQAEERIRLGIRRMPQGPS